MTTYSFRVEGELEENIKDIEGDKSPVFRKAVGTYLESPRFGLKDEEYGELVEELANIFEAWKKPSEETYDQIYEAGDNIMDIYPPAANFLAISLVCWEENQDQKLERFQEYAGEYITHKIITGDTDKAEEAREMLNEIDADWADQISKL